MAFIDTKHFDRCDTCNHYIDSMNGCDVLCQNHEFYSPNISKIPTADVVEVNHGEWISLEAEIGLYSCSKCEHKILREKCNFCPNCGAKMDGRSDTDDR